ncbi:MAG TPA: AMP-binding protein, partial [Candidatus Dormibacteraeota bacterium]|nr:AMP-binding protein [Candidatus Dormibacteraeota bacterium]
MNDGAGMIGYRLSPQQLRAWRRAAAGAAVPTQAAAPLAECDVRGALARLREWGERLEILRTVFADAPGTAEPLQVVLPGFDPAWAGAAAVSGAALDVAALLSAEAARAAGPATGPNVRFTAVRPRAGEQAVLVATASPLCADRVTLAMLLAGARSGVGVADEQLQYADVAEWLREQAPGARVDGEAPADGAVGRRMRALPREAIERLLGGPGAHDLSTFDLLAAAALVAAWRSGYDGVDVVLPGRRHPDLARVAGPLAHAAPVRRPERGSWPLVDVARSLRDGLAAMSDVPGPALGGSSALVLVAELAAGSWRPPSDVVFGDDPGPIGLSIELDPDGRAIERRHAGIGGRRPGLDEVVEVLRQAAAGVASPGWVPGAPDAATALALFDAAAARDPWHPAVVEGETATAYGDLQRRSLAIAARLRARGAGAGDVVTLRMGRSAEAIAAMLGAWRIGAAFLPVSPAWPARRIEDLHAAAGSAALLTADDGPGAPASDGPAGRPAGHADLAYAIATSGTTGRPKLVGVEHGPLVRRLVWGHGAYPLRAADRVLHHAPLSFDFAMWEVFAPLTAGATVAIVPEAGRDAVAVLVETMRASRPTVAHFTPTLLAALLDVVDETVLAPLRVVFTGGEPLSAALAGRLAARIAPELWNQYGPTECTIDATSHRVAAEDLRDGAVPIGRPVGGAVVHVVDGWGELA